MSVQLADVLATGKEAIIALWRKRVQGVLTPAATPMRDVVDSLRAFVDELIVLLRESDDRGPEVLDGRAGSDAPEVLDGRAGSDATARAHGAQRFQVGFSLDTVVTEYELLRDCVLEHLAERQLSCTIEEFRSLSRWLDRGIKEALIEYTRQRDEAITRSAAEQFAFVAHELRNPLSAATAAAGLLQKRLSEDHDVRLIAAVQRGHGKILSLLDKVLVEHRLAAGSGGLPLQSARVPVAELVWDARAEAEAQASEKGIAIKIDAKEADHRVEVDPRLFRSALTNLVTNAVKFTREGGCVTVRARIHEGRFLVEVEDECGGLPTDTLERLLTPHVQLGGDRSGYGLGLAIVKQAIEAHGGTIQARNLAPRGCVFLVDVPAKRTDTSTKPS